jgi:glutamate N-acetyltransferase/amino-acid N-acetyltransferase
MQGAAGDGEPVSEDRVAVASTGVIGVPLDVDKVIKGILAARRGSSRASARTRSARRSARRTSSRNPRRSRSRCPPGTVRLSAQAKGAGMISPAFATMLCFVQTDAALAPETADLLLGVCVKRSFDRISVDGQLSTNDTAILHGLGASGVRVAPESDDELRLGEALDDLLRRSRC